MNGVSEKTAPQKSIFFRFCFSPSVASVTSKKPLAKSDGKKNT